MAAKRKKTKFPHKVKDLDDVPEEMRQYYEELEDGAFSIPGIAEKVKVDEFRDANVKLKEEHETLQKKLDAYGGADPEKVSKAMKVLDKSQDAEERTLLEGGKLEEVLARRTSTMRADFEQQLGAKDAKNKEVIEENVLLRDKLSVVRVDQSLIKALNDLEVKPRKGALPDLIGRAHQNFGVDDKGDLIPKKPDGSTSYGRDGEQLTMKTFATDLVDTAEHLFEGGGGGGSTGGEKKVILGSKVPWGDKKAFQQNIEKIAKGEKVVE